jgi:ribose transport system permease protein
VKTEMFQSRQDNQVGNKSSFFKEYRVETAMVLALITLCIILTILTPRFMTIGNIRNVMWQVTAMGIIAIGQTLIILTSGIDLSVGGIAAFSAMFGGLVMMKTGVGIGVPSIIITGLLIGLFNGYLIAYAKLAPFIVTLGTVSISRSLTYVITDGHSLVGLPSAYRFFGNGIVANIPFYTIVFILLFILGHIILIRTKLGRFLYAIGSNEEAARLSGVNVKIVKTAAYTITGALCAISAIILTSRLGAVDPDTCSGIEMDTIAAVVIGGSSLLGGKGSLVGTFIGVFIIGVLHNGLNLIGVSPFWQGSAIGAVIIASVLMDRLFSQKN